jgi:hypothetical protein
MIHDLFIAHESFYREEILKRNIALIVLIRENTPDICINVDEKYL